MKHRESPPRWVQWLLMPFLLVFFFLMLTMSFEMLASLCNWQFLVPIAMRLRVVAVWGLVLSALVACLLFFFVIPLCVMWRGSRKRQERSTDRDGAAKEIDRKQGADSALASPVESNGNTEDGADLARPEDRRRFGAVALILIAIVVAVCFLHRGLFGVLFLAVPAIFLVVSFLAIIAILWSAVRAAWQGWQRWQRLSNVRRTEDSPTAGPGAAPADPSDEADSSRPPDPRRT